MKAIRYTEYGAPTVLQLREVEKPTPADDQVLLKVHAASVNPLDWHTMRGDPYLVRLMAGLFKPKETRLGTDVAGVVEAVGANVTEFKVGNEVFGVCDGAFAEYATPKEKSIVHKPANLSFEQAASIPVAAITALQGLRDHGKLQAGQKVLINGAAGGVGTFAVQIAKALGTEVTGVCSTRNVEMVRSLGADYVIDYSKENFTRSGKRYDLLFDNISNHSISASRGILEAKGILVIVGGESKNKWLGPLARPLAAMLVSRFVSQSLVFFLASLKKDDMLLLKEMAEAGKLNPVIDRCYPLHETAEAVRYVETGHARGKVVITVCSR